LLRKQQKTLGGYFFLPHPVIVVASIIRSPFTCGMNMQNINKTDHSFYHTTVKTQTCSVSGSSI